MQPEAHMTAMATMRQPFAGLLQSSWDFKEQVEIVVPSELALETISRNSSLSPALVKQSIYLSTFILMGKSTSSQSQKGLPLEFRAVSI